MVFEYGLNARVPHAGKLLKRGTSSLYAVYPIGNIADIAVVYPA